MACGGVLHTPWGDEPVLTALYFDEDTVGAEGATWLIAANSAVPCEAEEVEDDPDTEEDEEASAEAYWDAQVAASATREGALLVLIFLDSEGEDGRWAFSEAAWTGGADDADAGRALWYHVEEAEAERDGVVSTSVPTRVEWGVAGEEGWVELRELGAGLNAAFSLAPEPVTGTFTAQRCASVELAAHAAELVSGLAFEASK
jgi:hypothetical protein